jgi:hypothetical protein
MKQLFFLLLLLSVKLLGQNVTITKEWGTYGVIAYFGTSDSSGNFFTSTTTLNNSSPISHNLSKFSSSGALLWTTALPYIEDVKLDQEGNLIVCGYVSAEAATISTPGVFQETFGGITDAFLMKLDSDGNVIWCTYFGGAANDYNFAANDYMGYTGAYNSQIVITPENDIVWVTRTDSENMATAGAFQYEKNDAVYMLSKFTTNGQREWSTYYGILGSASIVNGLQVDENGIYISGGFENTPNNPNTYFDTFNEYTYQYNEKVVFVSKFNHNGSREWSRCLTGNGVDASYRNTLVLNNDKLYVSFGSNSNNLGTPGTYKPIFSGTFPGVLAQISLTGTLNWATYLPDGFLYALNTPSIYKDNNTTGVYVVGSTMALSGNDLDYYNPSNAGTFDPYVMKFNEDGELEYGFYCGGGSGDEYFFYGLSFYNGYFYFYGRTTSTSNIATPGAYQENYNAQIADGMNGFLTKYKIDTFLETESFNANAFSVFPNPTKDSFQIKTNKNNIIFPLQLSLYNSLGQLVKSMKITQANTTVTTNTMTKGVYILKVTNKVNSYSQKIIIQ